MKSLRALALALFALVVVPLAAAAQSAPVSGPTTFTFSAASQSNVWTCNKGQSSFSLIVPAGFTGTFTVTVAQTSGGTYVNPPWAYTPGTAVYTNTLTNSGALTVNLGSNGYVKVADTSYTSGSVTVTGTCSGAVAVVPPQIAGINAGTNIVVSAAPTPTVSTTMAPTFTKVSATGQLVAGSGTAPVCTAGDGCFSRSLTSGAMQLGGSTSSCLFDFGITLAGDVAIGCNTQVTGTLKITGLSASSGVCTDANKTLSSCTVSSHVKLAIGLGFSSGAVSTSTVYPYQSVVNYTNGEITGMRAACGTPDDGTTVVTLYKNGVSVGTLTLSTSQGSSVTFGSPVTISAGDILNIAITTAGAGQNCGFIAEGQQDAF